MATSVRILAIIFADLIAAFALYVMMNYLTNVWNLSTTHAAAIINFLRGIIPLLAFVFAFFVDAFSGHFYMLVFSSIACSIGLGLLTMSTPAVFGPCKDDKKECIGHKQKVLFHTALVFIAAWAAGRMVSLWPFSYTQTKGKYDRNITKKNKNENQSEKIKKNENESEEENKMFLACILMIIVMIVGGIGLSYVKPWKLQFGIPAICSVVATVMLLTGRQKDKHNDLEGNLLTTNIRVFVATACNFSKPILNPSELCHEDGTPSTNSLRCFDKATIKLPDEQQPNKWKVCDVREVEHTKIYIRLLPVSLIFIMVGIVLSIGNTYYLEQANHLDKKVGNIKVTIPNFLLFYVVAGLISASFYSLLSMCTKIYAPPIGIAMSMILSVLCCIVAANVEARRLHRLRDHGLLDKPDEEIPMSIFALLPQFMLLAAVDRIANASITAFYKHQTPQQMHKYLNYCTKVVLGLGSMSNVLLVNVVGKMSERNGKPSWLQHTLNKSRLDRYYWVLAGLSAVNLVTFVIVAYFYRYKESPDGEEDHDLEEQQSN